MTVPSVKVSLDKEYELRFEQDDVIACEDEMKMGYVFFFRVERLNGILVPTVPQPEAAPDTHSSRPEKPERPRRFRVCSAAIQRRKENGRRSHPAVQAGRRP